MNHIPSEFDEIRPFNPEELPAVYDRLLANRQFRAVLHFLYPHVPIEHLAVKMKACKTGLEFQKNFCYAFLRNLIATASRGITMDSEAIDNRRRYTFISNHRDIVLDSAFLDMLLIEAGFDTTCEIAIGDNLLSLPWVLDVVRLNKSFIVKRGLMAKDRLANSIVLSRYMHYAITQKQENLWIAQREGRAKDSDDRTQKSIIKMLALGGEGSLIDRLQALHIVPLSISYEYDPCDFLKAAEFQLKRDNPDWRKGEMDDVISMRTGIAGFKGHIHYHCAPCIDEYLEQLRGEKLANNVLVDKICEHIDREIHCNYKLYPCNYIAMDELEGTNRHADRYSEHEREVFLTYLRRRISKIDIPHKDTPFLRERLLTMYANPGFNHLSAVPR